LGNAMACAIWGSAAQILEKAADYEVLESPRAGGKYWISGTGAGQLISFTDNAKLLLTTWLCDQRHAGDETPKIYSNVLELIKSRQRLSVPQRLTAALLFIGRSIPQLGMSLSIGDGEENNTMRFLAETESLKPEEASTLVGMLREMGLIDGSFALGGYASVHPTVAGWQEIERLGRPQADSAQAFVAMWFDESTNDAYFRGIAPAVSGMGYKSVRIDKMEHNNKIGDEIIAEIRRSRFLVADFTCQAGKVRGGSLL
jgi:hypothetical protein